MTESKTEFRRRLLHARDLTATEFRRIMRFFEASAAKRHTDDERALLDRRAFKRVSALYRMKIREETSDHVSGSLEISARQLWRWVSWYDKGGLRALLNDLARLYGQCSSCLRLFTRTSSPWRCKPCNSERMRKVRETAQGSLLYQRHLESGGDYKAHKRYRRTEKGKATRQREARARAFREARA